MPQPPLLQISERGLYCAVGDFYIDPWKPVGFAVTTHAHSDHARSGSQNYLCAEAGRCVLQERLGAGAAIEGIPYGEKVTRRSVTVSLHPAGHILGSAQVRVEHQGEVWVVSGDYKLEAEPTCAPFEPVRCDTFITECTFGLPIYRWRPQAEIFDEINRWWRQNQSAARASILHVYSLGKAQRVLAGVDASIGPIFVHGGISRLLPAYAAAGVKLPAVQEMNAESLGETRGTALVLAPSAAENSPWLRRFGEASTAFASGWMQLRGARRRRALDRGFTLSDHADWDGLLSAISATGAQRIFATHGDTAPLVRWLRERGLDAHGLKTQFTGDAEEISAEPASGHTAAAEALLPL